MKGKFFQEGVVSVALIVLLALLGGGGLVVASDSARPGDALYGLEQAVESIRLAFTLAPEAQAKVHTSLASERIEEAISLAGTANREEHFEQALARYQEHLQKAQEKAAEAQSQGKDVEEIQAILAENALRHQEVLEGVYERVPEQAKSAIERAIENSQRGYETAVKAISGEKREEVLDKTRDRLEEVRTRLEEKGVELPEIEIPETEGQAAPEEVPAGRP